MNPLIHKFYWYRDGDYKYLRVLCGAPPPNEYDDKLRFKKLLRYNWKRVTCPECLALREDLGVHSK